MYEIKTRVAFSDIDSGGYLSIGGLIHKLQDCCSLQSEDVGYGLEWLSERGLGWYIISWQIHIHRLPYMGEQLRIKTMPYLFRGYFGNRNFTVENEKGELLAEANSAWILMDIKNAVPYRLPKEMVEAYGLDEELPIEWPNRKIPVPKNREKVYGFEVSPMHVDTNFHMSNSHYVEAAVACLPPGESVKELYAEYKKQARLSDQVTVCMNESDGQRTVSLEDNHQEPFACVIFR